TTLDGAGASVPTSAAAAISLAFPPRRGHARRRLPPGLAEATLAGATAGARQPAVRVPAERGAGGGGFGCRVHFLSAPGPLLTVTRAPAPHPQPVVGNVISTTRATGASLSRRSDTLVRGGPLSAARRRGPPGRLVVGRSSGCGPPGSGSPGGPFPSINSAN